MKYRSREDIVAAILEIAKDSVVKTHIMYRAFLSYPQLQEYLDLLQEKGLLEYHKHEKEYLTTEEGKRFLKMYKELDKMIPKENMLTKIIET